MDSAATQEAPELAVRCLLDNVQGLVDALSCIRWKKQQDAICELSEHGMVITVEEWTCLQARVYFRKELFREYQYQAGVRPRFGVSLALLIDCLHTFTSSTGTTALELCYPGPDMQLLLKLIDANNSCINAEIRTRIPESIPREYIIDDEGNLPISFAVKSAALKEVIDDLEWPGSNITITLSPAPPGVSFRGEGHGDLQIDLPYDTQQDLFIAFQCNRHVSHRYKYKFLRATTSQIPNSILKDNRGSKVTIGSTGLLKVQHLISVRPTHAQQHHYMDPSQVHARVSYIEFYVMPDEDDNNEGTQ
ncbi:hypothetical protein BDL97_15G057500 [Sphagnum fallax]|uniref:Cell cycle checkpoint protein RAD1 n=1 Tax=Sphagnum jensenii TaxID=128206 RepID=A0ABP0W9Y5_9BRYO|nr:hypothetical protein BDL97_15G057500 [Sphagnum fallax]